MTTYNIIKNELETIGCGHKIDDIIKIFNKTFNLKIFQDDQFEKLPIDIVKHIISMIPDINNIRTKCMYRGCNKKWKNIMDKTNYIEVSDKDIIKGISSDYLSRISNKIKFLKIKFDHTPHAIRAEMLHNFIKQFPRLEEFQLWTWEQYSENDLKLLLKIGAKRWEKTDII